MMTLSRIFLRCDMAAGGGWGWQRVDGGRDCGEAKREKRKGKEGRQLARAIRVKSKRANTFNDAQLQQMIGTAGKSSHPVKHL